MGLLFLSTFGVIFMAELPDKTSLAALVLATRYPARQVVIGAWLAFLVQTLVAVVAGSLLRLLPSQPVRIAAGLGFLVFAVLQLRRMKQEEKQLEEEAEEVETTQRRHWAPWMSSFLVVFAAEWGDLTQLATAAMVAHTDPNQPLEPLVVAVAATIALWCVTLIAVLAGSQIGRFVQQGVLNIVSAVLFTIVGLVVIASAFHAA